MLMMRAECREGVGWESHDGVRSGGACVCIVCMVDDWRERLGCYAVI